MDRAGAVETDHVVVEHLGKTDARAAGERMSLRHHQNKAVTAEWKCMQAAVVNRAGDNADIAGAVRDQADNLVA